MGKLIINDLFWHNQRVVIPPSEPCPNQERLWGQLSTKTSSSAKACALLCAARRQPLGAEPQRKVLEVLRARSDSLTVFCFPCSFRLSNQLFIWIYLDRWFMMVWFGWWMFMAADVELLLLLEVLLTESFEHQWAFMRIASTPLPDLPEAANAVPCPSRELAAIVLSACELKEDG